MFLFLRDASGSHLDLSRPSSLSCQVTQNVLLLIAVSKYDTLVYDTRCVISRRYRYLVVSTPTEMLPLQQPALHPTTVSPLPPPQKRAGAVKKSLTEERGGETERGGREGRERDRVERGSTSSAQKPSALSPILRYLSSVTALAKNTYMRAQADKAKHLDFGLKRDFQCPISIYSFVWKREPTFRLILVRNTAVYMVCRSHITSHSQVRGHRTGSSHSGAEEYPRDKTQTNQGWYTHTSQNINAT